MGAFSYYRDTNWPRPDQCLAHLTTNKNLTSFRIEFPVGMQNKVTLIHTFCFWVF